MLVPLQLVGVAAVPLKLTALLPCVEPKFAPVIVTEVPGTPDVGDKLLMLGAAVVTVKLTPLLGWPPATTITFPVVAPLGTGTTMLVPLQLVGVAAVPLKLTVLLPCVEPKFAPVIVTELPGAPDVGDKLLMLGAAVVTVKLTPLLGWPPATTITFPVVAPLGTGATMLVPLQLVGVAAVPLKLTVLLPCVEPKFAPVIVTELPGAPDVGDKLLMLGAAVVTVKLTPLLGWPPATTITFPVVAPLGTGATMLVPLQLVGVAAVPLKLTVLLPCVEPKFAPVIVTEVPGTPDVGERLLMLGATPWAGPTPAGLNAAMSAIQALAGDNVHVAAVRPAELCTRSSSAYAAAFPRSTRLTNPAPDVKVSPSPTASSTPQPKIKSPFAVVVAEPLVRLLPVPILPAQASSAPTPWYSWTPIAR